MKLCFPVSSATGIDAEVFGHFGSAPAFLLVDSETLEAEPVINSDAEHAHGACNPAAALAGANIDAIVVGGIGAGALAHLMALDLKVYQAKSGSVRENVEHLKNGDLLRMVVSSCGSHGHGHSHGHGGGSSCCHH